MPNGYKDSGYLAPEEEPRGDMWKIWAWLLAVAIFVIVLMGYIIPEQGGPIPSTIIYLSKIAAADPVYQAQLPIQESGLGEYGRSIYIAVVMETHVVFADLHTGGSWIILSLIVLWLASKKRRYLHLGRSMTLFNVIIFSVGATFPLGGFLFFISLFPTFTVNTFHVYWWPLFIETFTFGAEIFLLYFLWFSWGHIKHHWHVLIAVFYALDVFLQYSMIDTLAAGMLTPKPGVTTINWFAVPQCIFCMPFSDYMAYWFNATFWQLNMHRISAGVSAYGFIIAFIAAFHLRDRRDPSSRKLWDWAITFGLFWGLLGLAFQPLSGVFYMFQVMTHQNAAFAMIMTGPRAWEMLMMVGIVSFTIIITLIYFLEGRKRLLTKNENRWIRWTFTGFIVFMVGVLFVLVNPAWVGGVIHPSSPGAIVNPLGNMYWKHWSFMVMEAVVLVSVGVIAMILGRTGESDWGNVTHAGRWAAAIAGLMGSLIVYIMGYVRESGRDPWLLYNIIPVPGGAKYLTPVLYWIEMIIWLLGLTFAYLVFYYISRITAEHPEEEEAV